MKFNIINQSSRIAAAICLVLFGSISCVEIDPELGRNFIPTDQKWDVFLCEDVPLKDITLLKSEKLSGYSKSRITFGSIKDDNFRCDKGSSFTLVPIMDTLDFGESPEVLQFHFTAVRDTVSLLYDNQARMLQDVYVYSLKTPLDSNVLYISDPHLDNYVDYQKGTITSGIPVYNGGDSLSFDFSKEYARSVIDGIDRWQRLEKSQRDSLNYYLKEVPGIYIKSGSQNINGGRINMFNLPIKASDGYIEGNYAELKIRSKYNGVQRDTMFVFYFGPSEFLTEDAVSYPTQYAFNSSENISKDGFWEEWESSKEVLYVEGGAGFKPVVKAEEIRNIVKELIEKNAPDADPDNIVINKATIILPYNVGTSYEKLDKYPLILSPTVKLLSDNGSYTSYAGLTDSSIETENQGDINRSLNMYCPDISHHVQEIIKLSQKSDETDEKFKERLEKYDIWFLIMHEETTESSSTSTGYDDYYNNLLYNSYYNNMMYDPYGYGYGYGGYGGYGYGGYGYGYGDYGYSNYYNYMMMAQYASASNSSTTSSSIELDKDRFYSAILNGPNAASDKPRLKITFSAPKKLKE